MVRLTTQNSQLITHNFPSPQRLQIIARRVISSALQNRRGGLEMIKRILALGGISIGMCLAVCSTPQTAVAQQRTTSNAGWTAPKTPWGEPDLQGIWPL